MSFLSSYTEAQLTLLRSLLCQPGALTLLQAEEPGGCDDADGEAVDPILGTPRDDSLIGGPGRDSLIGLSGDDLLDGAAGKDLLDGGSGHDELRGGKGKDTLLGGTGFDLLTGGCGPDRLDGGPGGDVLVGGNSPDVITGGSGRDVFVLTLPGGDHGGGHAGLLKAGGSGHDSDHTEGDLITDFRPGVDVLGLGTGLAFDGRLLLQDNQILWDKHGDGSEKQLLATLSGVKTSSLGRSDFLTCSDLPLA